MKEQNFSVGLCADSQLFCVQKRSFYANYFTILFCLGLFLTPSVLEAQTCSGNAASVISQTGVDNPTNALGNVDGTAAQLWDTGDQIVLDLNAVVNTGSTLVVTWRGNTVSSADPTITIETSLDGTTFTAVAGSPLTIPRTAAYFTNNIIAPSATRYVRLTTTTVYNVDLDALTYTNQTCSPICGTNNTAGTVWQDYDSDGIKEANETQGVEGVTVKAFDCNNVLAETATTDVNGEYAFTSLTPSVTNKYRIEFSNIPPQYQPTLNGSNGKTDVQFISAANCFVDFGVNASANYCQADPPLMINCYVTGAYNSSSGNGHTIVGLPYSISQDPDGNTNGTTVDGNVPGAPTANPPVYTPARTIPTSIADHNQVGSTWGLAYDRDQKNLFAAAYVKSGTSLGPNGESTGKIFKINNPLGTPVTSDYVDLNVIFGAGTAGINPHPVATASFNALDDAVTNAAIGKVGLGDLAISNDNAFLYVVNLADRQLYKIPTSGALNSTTISRFPIPTTGLPTVIDAAGTAGTCPTGDMRPFGLGVHTDGSIYVGGVCSAESISAGINATTNDASYQLTAYVWKFDGTAFSLQLNESLRFDRDGGNGYATTDDFNGSYTGLNTHLDWEPWHDLSVPLVYNGGAVSQNEPMLADITFDEKGDMFLGVRDRAGDIISLSGGFLSSGDIYKACKNGTGWTFEKNAKCGAVTTNGANNNQGPGGGEFIYQDIQGDGLINSGTGGVFNLMGRNQIISTSIDPVFLNSSGTPIFNPGAGGIQVYGTQDGKIKGAFDLYENGDQFTFAKAAGIGAIAALCVPAPIEIGNYVWIDTDGDGVQDPCETPLSNLTVKLYKMDGGTTSLVATTATDANGNYYFKDYEEFGTAGYDTLMAGKMYFVVLEDATFNNTTGKLTNGGKQYLLTTNDATASNGNDQNDSDAAIVASGKTFDGYPANTVTIPTNAAGYVNHTLDFGFKPEPCSMTITNVLVSDCFQQAGASKTAIQITVNWANAPVGDSIRITVGGVNKFIVPTAAGSPQMIQFVVDANGSTGNSIAAAFTTAAACSATSTFNAPAACPPDPCAGAGNLGGKVWVDYNMNGVTDATDNQRLAGITVNIYDCNNNLVGTDVTDANGDWYKSGLAFGGATDKYRVEFSTLPPQYSTALDGTNSKTTVQFVSAATCNVDLGINIPADYCQINPNIVLSCFAVGNPLVAGTTSGIDAIVTFPYLGSVNHTPAPTHEVYANAVGSVWGLALQKERNEVFSAAFVKRHSGLGSLGTGGIYVTNFNDPARPTVPFLDLSSLTGTIGARDLTGDVLTPSRDTFAFNLNGKRGLGDLDISEDGKTLWTVNLNTNDLVKIDISNYVSTGTLPTLANVTSFPIPAVAGCPTSDSRVMGIGIKSGKIFVTNTCTGESTQSFADLKTAVYNFDPTATTFTQVVDLKLNYRRGHLNNSFGSQPTCETWVPWTHQTSDFLKFAGVSAGDDWPCYSQPVASDIVFDNDGTMILAIMDRSGHQMAYQNYSPIAPSTTLYNAVTGGDVLRFTAQTSGQYIVESGGVSGAKTSVTANNKQGPGGGEFYGQDGWITPQPWEHHSETAFGALMFVPGSSEVGVTRMDPLNNTGEYGTGGIGWYSNINGDNSRANGYSVYPLGGFGKGNGLGSLENMCAPAPAQIGNYAWIDADSDGVQDPCETPLSNLTVKLYKIDGGTTSLVASTTTDLNGNYTFKDYNEFGTGYDTLTAGKMYVIVLEDPTFNTTSGRLTNGGNTYQLTTKDATAGNGNDGNDSDAIIATGGNPFDGYPVSTLTIPISNAGYVNHALDFGFKPTCDTTLIVNNATICNGSSINLFTLATGVKGTLTYSTDGTTWTALANPTNVTPSVNTTYYVRDELTLACFDIDTLTITVNPVPTGGTVQVTKATCSNGLPTNTDGKIEITGIMNGTKYSYGTSGSTGLFALNGLTLSGGAINLSNLASPTGPTTYTFRIYGADTTCYKDITAILDPSVCPTCSITATITQNSCNSNNTPALTADDYFTVTVTGVSSTNGGTSGKYEVILNGNALNIGGTAYGTPVTVGGILDFKSDGSTTYNLTVRDFDMPTCVTTIFTTAASAACSTVGCKPVICLPVTITKF